MAGVRAVADVAAAIVGVGARWPIRAPWVGPFGPTAAGEKLEFCLCREALSQQPAIGIGRGPQDTIERVGPDVASGLPAVGAKCRGRRLGITKRNQLRTASAIVVHRNLAQVDEEG